MSGGARHALGLRRIAPEARAQAGSSGLAFLKLGVAGRGVAMADAMAASTSGVSSLYYKPPGLLEQSAAGPSTRFMFTHKEWIQDTRLEFLGGTARLGENGGLGASITSTSISDIEIRTAPGKDDVVCGIGTLTPLDLAASKLLANSDRQADDGVFSQGRRIASVSLRAQIHKRYWLDATAQASWGGTYDALRDRDYVNLAVGMSF
ncbi:MAG: DUF1302 domain-containing protein [Zoogloea sp.]|nr:DUF1302 domain-containing protein [Zoogloea sp.]